MSEFRLRAVAAATSQEPPPPTIQSRPHGAWWGWQPVHGGAGVTTMNRALPGGHVFGPGRSDHDQWPTVPVVAVCRSHSAGLLAAQTFAQHVHNNGGWTVLGLVVVADVPGRLPRQLEELLQLVSGGFTQTRGSVGSSWRAGKVWRVGWVEQWRRGEPVTPENTPDSYRTILRDLAEMTEMSRAL